MTVSRRDFLAGGLFLGGTLALPFPRALAAADTSAAPLALTLDELKTVDAIVARLIPTDHEPGAREALCASFIDKALAHDDAAALPLYRVGLQGVDAVAMKRSNVLFRELAPDDQNTVLAAIEDGNAEGWPEDDSPSPLFFGQIWLHTVWGFLADPKYGGNHQHAGWRVLGYPGGRHKLGGYTPEQMAGRAQVDSVWGEKLPRKPGDSTG